MTKFEALSYTQNCFFLLFFVGKRRKVKLQNNLKRDIPGIFFVSSVHLTVGKHVFNKHIALTGFELWSSGVESDRSANWATTTAQALKNLITISFYKTLRPQIFSHCLSLSLLSLYLYSHRRPPLVASFTHSKLNKKSCICFTQTLTRFSSWNRLTIFFFLLLFMFNFMSHPFLIEFWRTGQAWTSLNLILLSQSYKQFMLVIYDSRVIIWGIFKSGTTLES